MPLALRRTVLRQEWKEDLPLKEGLNLVGKVRRRAEPRRPGGRSQVAESSAGEPSAPQQETLLQ